MDKTASILIRVIDNNRYTINLISTSIAHSMYRLYLDANRLQNTKQPKVDYYYSIKFDIIIVCVLIELRNKF